MSARDRGARPGPRSLAGALEGIRSDVAPLTLLAAVQEAWPEVAGAFAAAQGEPVREREGTVTVACASATWAQELDFMQDELLSRLRERLGSPGRGDEVRGLRFTAEASGSQRP